MGTEGCATRAMCCADAIVMRCKTFPNCYENAALLKCTITFVFSLFLIDLNQKFCEVYTRRVRAKYRARCSVILTTFFLESSLWFCTQNQSSIEGSRPVECHVCRSMQRVVCRVRIFLCAGSSLRQSTAITHALIRLQLQGLLCRLQ